MTEFTLQISGGALLKASHEFVIGDPNEYTCTCLAAAPPGPENCVGFVGPGEAHALISVEGHPLFRYCVTCSLATFGEAFYRWVVER